MPTVLLFSSITNNELTFLSRIFSAASWADEDASIVSSFSVIKSPIFAKLTTLNRADNYPYKYWLTSLIVFFKHSDQDQNIYNTIPIVHPILEFCKIISKL
jgi:hypothetical protein